MINIKKMIEEKENEKNEKPWLDMEDIVNKIF